MLRWVAGEGWLHYVADAELNGFVLWGRADGARMAALIPHMDTHRRALAGAQVQLVDMRRVDGADPSAFQAVADYIDAHREELVRTMRRQALVRPGGPAGAMIAGFYDVVRVPWPASVVATPEEAAAALGRTDVVALLGQLDGLAAEAGGAPATAMVRAAVGEEGSVEGVARRLGMSSRTLQRRLRDEGTSFQRELARARIERAKRLLVETDAKITAIAFEVGCASAQHFGAMFRRSTGETPRAWRARRR